MQREAYPAQILVKDRVVVFDERHTQNVLVLVRGVLDMGEDAEDTGIGVAEFGAFKEVPFGLYTEVLIGIKLQLKWANQLSNVTAWHSDIAIGAIVAIHSSNLILPQSSKVVKVHFRYVDEA